MLSMYLIIRQTSRLHHLQPAAAPIFVLCSPEGGTSVWTLMMSPLAKGLFHAAVDMSGSYIYNATLEQAEVDNLAFLNKTGCGDLACLRRLSIGQVLQVGGGGGRQSILTGEPCCKKSVKGNEAMTVIKNLITEKR